MGVFKPEIQYLLEKLLRHDDLQRTLKELEPMDLPHNIALAVSLIRTGHQYNSDRIIEDGIKSLKMKMLE